MDNGFTAKQKAAIIKAAQAYTSRLYAEFIAEKAEELLNPQPTLPDRVAEKYRELLSEDSPGTHWDKSGFKVFKSRLAKALKAAGVEETPKPFGDDQYATALEVWRCWYKEQVYQTEFLRFENWLEQRLNANGPTDEKGRER